MSIDYGHKSYWDQRYSEDNDLFDWYQRFDLIKPKIQDLLDLKTQSSKILHVGCGNSNFGEVSFFVFKMINFKEII